MISVMRRPTLWFPDRSDTNQAVQAQNMARGWKFWIWKVEELYYPCSENKGADQLRSNCEADLRLCFRICKSLSSKETIAVLALITCHSSRSYISLTGTNPIKSCLCHMLSSGFNFVLSYYQNKPETEGCLISINPFIMNGIAPLLSFGRVHFHF